MVDLTLKRSKRLCYNPPVFRRINLFSVRVNALDVLGIGVESLISRKAKQLASVLCVLACLMFLTSASTVIVQKGAYVLPGNLKHIKTDALTKSDLKFVAITIDDTPDAVYTKKMLQVLLTHSARATFFVNGPRVKAFPETSKMMVAAGHEIANHTWNHPMLTKLTAAKVEWELTSTNNIIEKICGVTPRFFRPPYGSFNATVTKTALKTGLVPLLWSIDTRDWTKPGVSKIRSTVAEQLHNGAVILMHGTNEQSPAALDLILTDLENKGYKTVTVSEWFQLVGGSEGYELQQTEMYENTLEKLYDKELVTTPEGETIEILVPKKTEFDLKLADLSIAVSDSGLSIYSNLSLVDSEVMPSGLVTSANQPPNLLKPKHNAVELTPDGRTYRLALTDSLQIEYDDLYYPRPRLIMVLAEEEFSEFTLDQVKDVYLSFRFEGLVVLANEKEYQSDIVREKLIELKQLNPIVVSNSTSLPVFTIDFTSPLVQCYVDLLRQKRATIAVKLTKQETPSDLQSLTELQEDFLQFRKATRNYTYDMADELRSRWNLPTDIEIGRYTGYNIIVITLFSRTAEVYTISASANDTHLEIMSHNESNHVKYDKITAGLKIEINSTPKYIVYRWGEGASATHNASG